MSLSIALWIEYGSKWNALGFLNTKARKPIAMISEIDILIALGLFII